MNVDTFKNQLKSLAKTHSDTKCEILYRFMMSEQFNDDFVKKAIRNNPEKSINDQTNNIIQDVLSIAEHKNARASIFALFALNKFYAHDYTPSTEISVKAFNIAMQNTAQGSLELFKLHLNTCQLVYPRIEEEDRKKYHYFLEFLHDDNHFNALEADKKKALEFFIIENYMNGKLERDNDFFKNLALEYFNKHPKKLLSRNLIKRVLEGKNSTLATNVREYLEEHEPQTVIGFINAIEDDIKIYQLTPIIALFNDEYIVNHTLSELFDITKGKIKDYKKNDKSFSFHYLADIAITSDKQVSDTIRNFFKTILKDEIQTLKANIEARDIPKAIENLKLLGKICTEGYYEYETDIFEQMSSEKSFFTDRKRLKNVRDFENEIKGDYCSNLSTGLSLLRRYYRQNQPQKKSFFKKLGMG